MSEESDEEFVLSEEEEEEEGDKIVKQTNNDEIVVPFSYKHPPLPIIAPDYSYVMDITEMKSLLITKEDRKSEEGEEEGEEDPVSKVYRTAASSSLNNGYNFLLTIIDTTSRKVWQYSMKKKTLRKPTITLNAL